VTRYVTPLREGGSLPAIVEADDLGTYVLKFRGAGQGVKVLVAELIAGEIARAIGLPMPEIVLAELDPRLGKSEADPEIQSLITASAGLNLAIDYLPGSLSFDPAAGRRPDAELASSIVWFDALITNIDRTVRNPNMLVWHKKLWLIDHGASLYFHFGGQDWAARSGARFPEIKQHVLLRNATALAEADERLSSLLTTDVIEGIVRVIPDDWLADPSFGGLEDPRAAYAAYLTERLRSPRAFAEEARDAHAQLV